MPFYRICCPKKKDSLNGVGTYKNHQEEIENLKKDNEDSTRKYEMLKAELKEKEKELEVKNKEISELQGFQEKFRIMEEKYENLNREFAIQRDHIGKQENEFHKLLELKDEELKNIKQKLLSVMPKPESNRPRKREPVIPESQSDNDAVATKYHKSVEEKEFLKKAIYANDFFKHYNQNQVKEMVEYMHLKGFPQNDTLIKEGTQGDRFYILQQGECDVWQESRHLTVMKAGMAFGELAILYNCKRTATVKAKTPVKVWFLERPVFQKLMMKTAKSYRSEFRELVQDTPLHKLTQSKLGKIADTVDQEEYDKHTYIIRQGEIGKTFYIIKEGEVDITVLKENSEGGEKTETWVRSLGKGQCFGEMALRKEAGDKRTASVIAKSEKVICLLLDKESFNRLIRSVDMGWEDSKRPSTISAKSEKTSVTDIDMRDEASSTMSIKSEKISVTANDMNDGAFPMEPDQKSARQDRRVTLGEATLQDFSFIAILGQGGFGRVELIQWNKKPEKTFALKCMKKCHIVETRQEEHIYSEKRIMMKSNSPFIVQLYKTYRNDRYVYMLMEACLGGELWTRLRDENHFSDSRSKFYTACVVEALDFLHMRNIVYRDLKPENLLLDNRGYVKIVDFGFAKSIISGERTWTFCGTPEYVAPEIILNQGHEVAADYWALGILIFEFLTGNPPFNSADAMRTYRMALRGIDAIDMPVSIKKPAQNLIRRLCRENPSQRLGNDKRGISGIRDHKWFAGFHWEGLRKGLLKAEYVPSISGPKDVSHFDVFVREDEQVPVEISGWDKDF